MEESEENLIAFCTHISALEKQPHNPSPLTKIDLFFHTLKGSASILGLEAITKLATGSQDLLESTKGGSSERIDLVSTLLTVADSLENALKLLRSGKKQAPSFYDSFLHSLLQEESRNDSVFEIFASAASGANIVYH